MAKNIRENENFLKYLTIKDFDPCSKPLYDGDRPIQKYFPLTDIWSALEECVDKGLIKRIGVSNFDNEQVQHVLDSCRIKPFNNQVEIHPWMDQSELVEFHQKNDISVTSYMSLGRAQRSGTHGFMLMLSF